MAISTIRRQRSLRIPAFNFALAIVCSVALLVLIARAAVDVPFTDELQFGYLYQPIAKGQFPALHDLLAAHNGHPYLILKSLLTAVLLFGLPWSMLMYAQVLVLAAAFLLAGAHLPATASRTGLVGTLGLALAVMTPRQWENLYWAMQIAFPLALLFSMAAFHFVTNYAADGNKGNLSAALFSACIASLCNGSGVFAVALTVTAVLATRERHSRRDLSITLVASALTGALFLLSLSFSANHPIGSASIYPSAAFDHAMVMLVSGIGDLSQSNVLEIASGVLLTLLLIWLVFRAMSTWRAYIFELLCIAFSIILIVGVTYARLRSGIFQPDASRYVPLVTPAVVGLILIMCRMNRTVLLIALVSAIGIGYGQSLISEWRLTPYRYANLSQSLQSLCRHGDTGQAGISADEILAMQQLFCSSHVITRNSAEGI